MGQKGFANLINSRLSAIADGVYEQFPLKKFVSNFRSRGYNLSDFCYPCCMQKDLLMNRIRELREERCLTQKDLADALGTERYVVSNWEQGRTEPNVAQLKALANFFETSLDYVTGRSDELGVVEIQNTLSPDRKELLALYDKLSPNGKSQLVGFAKGLSR